MDTFTPYQEALMFTKTIRVALVGLGAAAALALGTGAATAATQTPVHTDYCSTTFDQWGMLSWQCF